MRVQGSVRKMKAILIMWLVIILLAMLSFTFMHEKTHQTIYSNYGIQSKLGIDWESVYVMPYDYENVSIENRNKAAEFNIQTEIVGYVLQIVLLFVMVTAMIISLQLEEQMEFKKMLLRK